MKVATFGHPGHHKPFGSPTKESGLNDIFTNLVKKNEGNFCMNTKLTEGQTQLYRKFLIKCIKMLLDQDSCRTSKMHMGY